MGPQRRRRRAAIAAALALAVGTAFALGLPDAPQKERAQAGVVSVPSGSRLVLKVRGTPLYRKDQCSARRGMRRSLMRPSTVIASQPAVMQIHGMTG